MIYKYDMYVIYIYIYIYMIYKSPVESCINNEPDECFISSEFDGK